MSKKPKNPYAGRGTSENPNNRFHRHTYGIDEEYLHSKDYVAPKTRFIEVFPKSIVNKVISPDVGMDYSLNPYQGCEHGCTYCYARLTHEYWGYSPGADFEQVIMIKKNAAELLEATFQKKSWKVKPIILSGNTDCYQPCENKYGITRSLLSVCLTHRHPVGIITKNVLIKRDFDLVAELAKLQLIKVYISITTLNEELRRKLEPRTATSSRKLELITQLTELGVPVTVMASPIIPALNDHEIIAIAKAAAEHGAVSFHSHLVRLMGPNESIFENWLDDHFPDRKEKVMNQLKAMHGGKTGSSNFGDRMKGTGSFANNIRQQRELAKNKFFPNPQEHELRCDLFRRPNVGGQLGLFD
ncbi:MAG: DNA repair photolyase [Crocinitomix sp.]|jgi:DNA repair photolyase